MTNIYPILKFNEDDSQRAFKDWSFNCGPGSICGIAGLTPDQVKPVMALLGFMDKGYTNPTLMYAALTALGIDYRVAQRSDDPAGVIKIDYGLVRIQWSGPWTKAGVPIRARYRKTHWIAVSGDYYFDINAVVIGGWIDRAVWSKRLVPWLLEQCHPTSDGKWWPTHQLEMSRDQIERDCIYASKENRT